MRKGFALLFLMILLLTGCSDSESTKPNEIDKNVELADSIIPKDKPNRDIVLDQVSKGRVSINDIEVYISVQNGIQQYAPDLVITEEIDKKITKEAVSKFNITEDEAKELWQKVDYLFMGNVPRESESLDKNSVPVEIKVTSVKVTPDKELEITLENNTEIEKLPTMNISVTLYKDGKEIEVPYIAWEESMKMGISSYKTFPIDEKFDSYNIVIFMNIDDMKENKLSSKVQSGNDLGETVVPVLKTEVQKVK